MKGFVKVADKQDLPPGTAMAVELNGKRIALFHRDGQYYAIDDECTHAGGSLAEGHVEGAIVTCPWHGATFDITNGQVLTGPAYDKVRSYSVRVEGEDIMIKDEESV
jgi:nitrite reductase/ring-hydroxylating ferredoxin subunit